jgi:hypothetical protein
MIWALKILSYLKHNSEIALQSTIYYKY